LIADYPHHMSASGHNDAVQKREESIPSFEWDAPTCSFVSYFCIVGRAPQLQR
jgi:hypothetical protein